MGVILSLMMDATSKVGTLRYLLMRATDVRCTTRSLTCIIYGENQTTHGPLRIREWNKDLVLRGAFRSREWDKDYWLQSAKLAS